MRRAVLVLLILATLTAPRAVACCISLGPFQRATAGEVVVLDTVGLEDGLLLVEEALKGPVSAGTLIEVSPALTTGNCNKMESVRAGQDYVVIAGVEFALDSVQPSGRIRLAIDDIVVAEGEDAGFYRREVASLHSASRDEILARFHDWVTMPWRRKEAALFLTTAQLDTHAIRNRVSRLDRHGDEFIQDDEIADLRIDQDTTILETVIEIIKGLDFEFPLGIFPASVDARLTRIDELLHELPDAQRVADILIFEDWDALEAIEFTEEEIDEETRSIWDDVHLSVDDHPARDPA